MRGSDLKASSSHLHSLFFGINDHVYYETAND
jgi:hypothetical protein